MKTYLILILLCSFSAAFALNGRSVKEEKQVKDFIKNTETSTWIVVYNKAERFVKVTDFNHQERSIIIPENEGLTFINDIIKEDPTKVKRFKIED
jgi:hypothetical protein